MRLDLHISNRAKLRIGAYTGINTVATLVDQYLKARKVGAGKRLLVSLPFAVALGVANGLLKDPDPDPDPDPHSAPHTAGAKLARRVTGALHGAKRRTAGKHAWRYLPADGVDVRCKSPGCVRRARVRIVGIGPQCALHLADHAWATMESGVAHA